MEESESGRLQELRPIPHPTATPLKISAKSMIVSLHKAWKICLGMDKNGESKHKIGYAFYVALKEVFSHKKN